MDMPASLRSPRLRFGRMSCWVSPPDARVLIVNNDVGMYHAINAAVLHSIEEGIASSCSLMVPCPWALHAMHLLRQRPEISFGIHLTLFCDTTHYRWGPLTAKEKVPSLLDGAGELFTPAKVPELLAQARLDQVELEFRAQVNTVLFNKRGTRLVHPGKSTSRQDRMPSSGRPAIAAMMSFGNGHRPWRSQRRDQFA